MSAASSASSALALVAVRPEDFVRAGVVFGRSAEVVASAVGQCGRSAGVDWVGPPTQPFQERLGELARDLGRMRRVFDEVCDALLVYGRALARVQDLAVRSELVWAQAHDLGRVRAAGGVLVPEAQELRLRERARLLGAEAEQEESLASGRLVAVLGELAALAPHTGRGARFSRSVGVFGAAAWAPVPAMAGLMGAAVASVPGVGDAASRAAARRQVWEAAKAAGQPWLMVEDLLEQLRSEQYAQLMGGLAPSLVLRSRVPQGRRVDLFGWHDALPESVLRALNRVDGVDPATGAWVAARAQREFLAELEGFAALPAPTLRELFEDVNLIQHEALGGHTIYKHVGRDEDFLHRRSALESPQGQRWRMSSFTDLDEAETLVREVLGRADVRERLARYAASQDPPYRFSVEVPDQGRLVVPRRGVARVSHAVFEFHRSRDGGIRLHTVFLDDRPRRNTLP